MVMKIVYTEIETLIEAEYNPRTITDYQLDKLEESIEKFGMVDPIIVNTYEGREGVVVGGHQRLRVLRRMGEKKVPVYEVSLNEQDERELNIRLNKNTGEFDIELLNEHFTTEELGDYGFEEYEIDNSDEDFSSLGGGSIERGQRNVLQIEFDKDNYEEARVLRKSLKNDWVNVGALFIDKMKELI